MNRIHLWMGRASRGRLRAILAGSRSYSNRDRRSRSCSSNWIWAWRLPIGLLLIEATDKFWRKSIHPKTCSWEIPKFWMMASTRRRSRAWVSMEFLQVASQGGWAAKMVKDSHSTAILSQLELELKAPSCYKARLTITARAQCVMITGRAQSKGNIPQSEALTPWCQPPISSSQEQLTKMMPHWAR